MYKLQKNHFILIYLFIKLIKNQKFKFKYFFLLLFTEPEGDHTTNNTTSRSSSCTVPAMGHSTVTPVTGGGLQSAVSSAPNTINSIGGPRECAGCGKRITERFLLKALDLFWHEDCLKCGCCDCRLGEVGSTLYTKANLILCKRDYLRYNKKKIKLKKI